MCSGFSLYILPKVKGGSKTHLSNGGEACCYVEVGSS